MALGRSRWIVGLLLAGGVAGCAETTVSTSDAGAPLTGCRNFAGAYIPQAFAVCSDTNVISVPLGACVSQDGCDLTIVTNLMTLAGKVTGDTFTVSGTSSIGPLQQECTGSRLRSGGIDLKCTVKAGSELKATCSLPSDLMDVAQGSTALCCDYATQDCATGQRCTAVNAENQSALPVVPTCMPITGTKKLDEDCARGDIVGLSNVGYDDCGAGLFCSGYGIAAGKSRVCRELCRKSSDCPSDRACQWLGNDVPVTGVCVPACDVFTGGCADTLTCRRYGAVEANGSVISAGVCEFVGTKAIGEACGSGGDCKAGLFCNSGARKCVAYCDDQHACEGGKTCNQFGGEPAGSTLGYCSLE